MKSNEAEELYGKGVTATQLIDLTNSVFEEVMCVMKNAYPQGITESVLDLLDKEENLNIFYDKIFDAVQECFTLPQIKILNQSTEDSGNYHLMYKKLHKYFKEKIVNSVNKQGDYIQDIYDDRIYRTIFREMKGMTPEPRDKNPNKWRDIPKSCQVDYNKIQEKFKN